MVVSNMAVNTEMKERTKKALGIFQVVTFPNIACTGGSSQNGTCYTAAECSSKGGTNSGTCASSFGVCCTFSLGCGSTTSENCTYYTVASFDTSTDSSPCSYTVCPISNDVCKLRIDFEAFSIGSPFTTAETCAACPITAIIANSIALKTGDCITDSFTVSSPGGSSSPVICGINTGQHIYVDADTACNKLDFNIDTATTTSRAWNLKVTQHNCGSDPQDSHDCLQYLTGTSGTFSSFNFDQSVTAVANGPSIQHLNDQYYDICFRREENYCGICYSPHIFNDPDSSFGVSASKAAIAVQGGVDDTCGPGAGPITGFTAAYADYITVDGLIPTGVTQSSLENTALTTAEKVCGQIFNTEDAQTASITACSYRVPFRWGVHFDGQELVKMDATPASINLNTHDVSRGGIGFYMDFWQKKC